MSEARAQRDRRLIQRTAALLSEEFPLDQMIERLCDIIATELDAADVFISLKSDDPSLLADENAKVAFRSGVASLDGTGTRIAVPVIYRERVLGVLAIRGNEGARYDEEDQRMLKAIARFVAIAVRNQRHAGILSRRERRSFFTISAIVLLALVLTIGIAVNASLRTAQVRQNANDTVYENIDDMKSSFETYVLDARQLVSSTLELLAPVRRNAPLVEKTLSALLSSSRSQSIYGIGVWYEPFVFDPAVRLYGPYAHRTPHGIIITHEWMRASYNFPAQPWYRTGVNAHGEVAFTEPYFDTDHVYVTAVRSFTDDRRHLAGTVTVDSIGPTLAGAVSLRVPGSVALVTTGRGTLLCSSDDRGLLAFARQRGPFYNIVAVPKAVIDAYVHEVAGSGGVSFSRPIAHTDWRITIVANPSALYAESQQIFEVAGLAILAVWCGAIVAIIGLARSRRHLKQARALEEQQRVLEDEISERIRAEERLREYAYRDDLTGLPNRAFAMAQLESQLARSRMDENHRFALYYIDIDNFNVVNDSLGHSTGDRLLVEFGRRLVANARSGDVVARLGGDEFVLIARIDTEQSVRVRATQILAGLRQPFNVLGHEFFVGASIGIAQSESWYEIPDEFLRDADSAMYEAKRAGRSTFRLFDRSMHEDAMERLALETDLRRGLERGEIFVEYQPIVSISSGAIVGFEALARWRHPTRGRVTPDTFIRLAEQTGLIVDIDERVVAIATEAARTWVAEFPEVFVAVNASAAHLARVDDLAVARRALTSSGLPPSSLKIEITETAVMANDDKSHAVLNGLRDLGVRVVIDDFGTGYSSLSHLQRLPVEELKIDRSFIANMLKNERSAEIVRAIVAISKTLHLKVTAEGVETEEQANRLTRIGVEYAQGYFYGMAVDAEMALRLLRTRLKRSVRV
jgi:diguanylate cyclase (GGDEF)-like protein